MTYKMTEKYFSEAILSQTRTDADLLTPSVKRNNRNSGTCNTVHGDSHVWCMDMRNKQGTTIEDKP